MEKVSEEEIHEKEVRNLKKGDVVRSVWDDKETIIEEIIFDNIDGDIKAHKGDRVTINGLHWSIGDITIVKQQKVSEAQLLNEAERIRDYYKDSFIFGFGTKENMKFLHFAQGRKDKFTIKKGIHKNIVMLDSSVKDYEHHVENLGKSEYKQCLPIPASEYFGV